MELYGILNPIRQYILECMNVCMLYISWRRKVPKSGGGGTQIHTFIYLIRTNINELYLDIWLFHNSHLCQFIEILHKIINWYMNDAK